MPNWCENTLLIRGLPEDIIKFATDNQDGPRITSVPIPEGLVKGTKDPKTGTIIPLSFAQTAPVPDGYYDDGRWHDWCAEHWGTKWDLDEETRVRSNQGELAFSFETKWLTYEFLTAWAPPAAWLATVAQKYPHLSVALKYKEEAMDFAGVVFCQGGTVQIDAELEVGEYDKDFAELLAEDGFSLDEEEKVRVLQPRDELDKVSF